MFYSLATFCRWYKGAITLDNSLDTNLLHYDLANYLLCKPPVKYLGCKTATKSSMDGINYVPECVASATLFNDFKNKLVYYWKSTM